MIGTRRWRPTARWARFQRRQRSWMRLIGIMRSRRVTRRLRRRARHWAKAFVKAGNDPHLLTDSAGS